MNVIPVVWPFADSSHVSFEEALHEAVARGSELHLLDDIPNLQAPIILKENDIHVKIIGKTGHRTVIACAAHSIFQINGKRSSLSLSHVQLNHTMRDNDKRNIGAAVFIMGRCRCEISASLIQSAEGFGIWCVQNAKCFVTGCDISAEARSAIVCFGSSAVELRRCRVMNCGQHGICLRGRCSLTIDDCDIVNCRVRAVYAYEHARIAMRGCLIEGTRNPNHAAVEIRAFGACLENSVDCLAASARPVNPERSAASSLNANNVIFMRNAGGAIRTIGNVEVAVLESYSWIEGSDEAVRIDRCDVTSAECASSSKDALLDREEQLTLVWEYHREDDQWIRYGTDVCLFLTKYYAALKSIETTDGRTKVALPPPLEHYEIDFTHFEQINTISHFSRKIRHR
jgi:hypothetical protein